MDIRTIVGQNCQRLRREAGHSQETFAGKTGLHRTYISGVERGVRNPTVAIVARIAKALKVLPHVLLIAEKKGRKK